MQEQTFSVPNIACGHCVAAIQSELKELDGVVSVDGDAAGKRITVEWDSPATLEQIKGALKEMNYPAE